MTTIYTGNTTTSAMVINTDTTGNLVVKTGGAGGTTALTVGTDQRVTFTQPPLTSTPLFTVRTVGNQTLTDQVWTKAAFNTIDADTHGWWDAANYRYTPQIAGFYQFNWQVLIGGTTIIQYYQTLYKNGAGVISERWLGINVSTGTGFGGIGSHFLYMNGSTDYVEAYAWIDASSGWQIGSGSRLQGFLVRAE